MSLAISCLERKIQIGKVEAFLTPPTVRQAVEILHFISNMEDEDDEQRLFELIARLDWKGTIDAVHSLRLLYKSNRILFGTTIKELLLQGYSPKKAQSDKGSHSSPKPDWAWFLNEYCRIYNTDPWQAYNIPFAFFMEMLSVASREKAKRHLDRAFEVSAGFGAKELTKKWSEEAYPTQPEVSKYSDEMSTKEKKEERKNFKKRLMQ